MDTAISTMTVATKFADNTIIALLIESPLSVSVIVSEGVFGLPLGPDVVALGLVCVVVGEVVVYTIGVHINAICQSFLILRTHRTW